MEQPFDVVVVGGGINGACSAAALAASGLRVALLERGDFAGETSMQSSNLAWGGIKYLEGLEFGLVWKLCRARNALMKAYPTAIRETRFLTTIPSRFRVPCWIVYAGAVLYWLIGLCFTRPPRLLSRRRLAKEQPLINAQACQGGLEYSDAHLVDGDARFVFGFVQRAARLGAVTMNYAEVTSSKRVGGEWQLEIVDRLHSGTPPFVLKARALVNAAGPFADRLNHQAQVSTLVHHVLSKGVHLIVPRLTLRQRVLAFFASDGRLFFVIPFGSRSCIGTTDTRVVDPSAGPTEADCAFILDNINHLLSLPQPLTLQDVVAVRCGVRPLAQEDGQADNASDWTTLSRRHIVEQQPGQQQLSIFGGKLTDCLNVASEVVATLRRLGVSASDSQSWFGEPPASQRQRFYQDAQTVGINSTTSRRLWRSYGEDAPLLLTQVERAPDLGRPLFSGADVLRVEAAFAGHREQVESLMDFLRRRTQLAQVLGLAGLGAAELRDAAQLLFPDRFEEELERFATESSQLEVPMGKGRP